MTRSAGDLLVVKFLDGDLRDMSRIETVGRELQEAGGRAIHKKLLLNLENVSAVSSGVIGELVRLHNVCKANSIHFRLCNIAPDVMVLLKAIKLTTLFNIDDCEEEAKASLLANG